MHAEESHQNIKMYPAGNFEINRNIRWRYNYSMHGSGADLMDNVDNDGYRHWALRRMLLRNERIARIIR